MGKIRKLLAMRELPLREITNRGLWVDLCENVHLHHRNVRLDQSVAEWAHLRSAIHNLGQALEFEVQDKGWREGDPNYLQSLHYNTPLAANSDYYPNRATLELQRDNTIHFHYRDWRIHLTIEEFNVLAGLFITAREQFYMMKPSPWENLVGKTFVEAAPMECIQPYDPGHLPGVIDYYHRAGIDLVKDGLLQGKRIRPILLATDGQRLDGFKRYWAYRELGRKTIPAVIDPFGRMGGQHNQSLFLEEETEQAPPLELKSSSKKRRKKDAKAKGK